MLGLGILQQLPVRVVKMVLASGPGGSLALLGLLLVPAALAQKNFADTCACPTPKICPSNCDQDNGFCDSYDSNCISGKTGERCNGGQGTWCPSGYSNCNSADTFGGFTSSTDPAVRKDNYPCPTNSYPQGFVDSLGGAVRTCPAMYSFQGRLPTGTSSPMGIDYTGDYQECCGCPETYTRVEQSGATWTCSGHKMYHCYRECPDITTGFCNKCNDGFYPENTDPDADDHDPETDLQGTSCETCPPGECVRSPHPVPRFTRT